MYMEANSTFMIKNFCILSNVVDGDGLILKNVLNNSEEEIRFLGIDAPESKRCKKLIQDERETHLPAQLLLMLGRLSLNFLIELIQIFLLLLNILIMILPAFEYITLPFLIKNLSNFNQTRTE